jgi:hypothetical protein
MTQRECFVRRTPAGHLALLNKSHISRTVCARRLARGGVFGQKVVLAEEASAVAGPRFILLSRAIVDGPKDGIKEQVTWMVVSPNSRPLGRAASWFDDIDSCRLAVVTLRERASELRIVISVTGSDWQWRGALDGTAIAASTRSYLRQHECDYNAQRFLEALPEAQLVAAVRTIRSGQPVR